jgi:hypothetical protein
MRPFPEGSSMVKTCPTNAGPKPPPPLSPSPLPPADVAPASPGIRELGSGVPRESEEAGDDDVEDEETGRRSGKARCGAAGEGGDAEDERKGKEEAREWKGLGEERGMVDRR